MLYPLLRPLLFSLDPETAHDLAFGSLDVAARCHVAKLALPHVPDDPVEVMGLRFANRVGLAAGLDKNAEHIDGLAAFGFGHIECGTVTPRPQLGNPKPRLFRIVDAEALVNRMGFNNDGLAAFLDHAARARYRGVLGLNIGKNFDTPNERAADDFVACLSGCYAKASYVAVNVSSPNTKGLRDLQHRATRCGEHAGIVIGHICKRPLQRHPHGFPRKLEARDLRRVCLGRDVEQGQPGPSASHAKAMPAGSHAPRPVLGLA